MSREPRQIVVHSITRMPNTKDGNPVWRFRDKDSWVVGRTLPDGEVGHRVSPLLDRLPVTLDVVWDAAGWITDFTEYVPPEQPHQQWAYQSRTDRAAGRAPYIALKETAEHMRSRGYVVLVRTIGPWQVVF